MRVYALTSSQVAGETLDLFVTREAAEAELAEILEDEPQWVDVLSVVPLELDERDVSAGWESLAFRLAKRRRLALCESHRKAPQVVGNREEDVNRPRYRDELGVS